MDNVATAAPAPAAPAGGEGASATIASTAPVAPAGEPTTAVAPSQTNTAASAAAGAQPAPAVWTDGMSPEHKSYVDGKGFKDSSAVLESYINLEKLRGVPQDRLLKLPETADSPDWEPLYNKLGKPDKPDGYGLTVAEGEDSTFIDWAKDAFHGLNMTKDQATGLVEQFNQMAENQKSDNLESYKQDVQNQEMVLKKEWGQAYHQNIANAQNAAKEFGIAGEAIDAIEKAVGFDGAMKLLNSIGEKLGESKYTSGTGNIDGFGDNILTPERARSEILTLKGDNTFVEKFKAGDLDARKKMENLHKMGYPS